jgi:hypothetical protein
MAFEEIYRTDFEALSETIRHYSKLRFTILNVFLLINTGLLFAVARRSADTPVHLPVGAAVLAVLLTFLFCLLETFLNGYLTAFQNFAQKTYPESHWRELSQIRPLKHVPVSSIVMLTYIVIGLGWMVLLFKYGWHSPSNCSVLVDVLAVGFADCILR